MIRPIERIVGVLLATLVSRAHADDVLHLGTPRVDPPTVITLGVQLPITGDDDFNAQVTVRYRPSAGGAWRDAMPLFRVHPETVNGRTVQPQFAGSIFDLAPNTSYDVELHATDPDGPVDETVLVTATTRPVPGDPQTPTVRPVANALDLQAALNAAQPGDVITLADGLYHGTFIIEADGTPENPIVIRGTTRDGTVLDGSGCGSCNVLEVYGSWVHVENLTLQHANRGVRFQGQGAIGNVVRRVHVRDVRLGIGAKDDQRDFYICDNVVEGRLAWPKVYTDDDGAHADDDGILVQGNGHVVCHNEIHGFGDALKTAQDGARAVDFYGNEVTTAYDNGVELDGSEGNTRAFRNRFTNTYATISFQPIFGGPAYAIRNVVVNVVNEQLKLHGLGVVPPQEPSGVLVLNNTFVSPKLALNLSTSAASHWFTIANNLFVGPSPPGARVADWSGVIDHGTLDYDGFFPDGRFDFDAAGDAPAFAAWQAASGLEAHGTVVSLPIFAWGVTAPASYVAALEPPNVELDAVSDALDRGAVFPNVNDGFTGAAPDLGAIEAGCPNLLFGVRPDGVDETNEPYGCGGPTVTTTTTSSTTTTTLPWVLIEATALSLRDSATTPSRRGVTFRASTRRAADINRIVPPQVGSAGDPTVGGATLTVYNAAGSGQRVVVALPASGWTALGSPSRPSGYRFKGAPTAAIRAVTVRGDAIALKGNGAGWTYSLAAPPQQRIALRLGLGTDRPWCAEAPAKPSGSPPSTAANDRADRFVGQARSPAPPACAPVP